MHRALTLSFQVPERPAACLQVEASKVELGQSHVLLGEALRRLYNFLPGAISHIKQRVSPHVRVASTGAPLDSVRCAHLQCCLRNELAPLLKEARRLGLPRAAPFLDLRLCCLVPFALLGHLCMHACMHTCCTVELKSSKAAWACNFVRRRSAPRTIVSLGGSPAPAAPLPCRASTVATMLRDGMLITVH